MRWIALVLLLMSTPAATGADLVVLDFFDPAMTELPCGVGFNPTTGGVWVYECFDDEMQLYSQDGCFLSSVSNPGDVSNDADIDFATTVMSIAGTSVPEGTMFFIDGETGTAEIYAIDPANGDVLATLATDFGDDHVVGGAYHPGRNTFFLLQDRLANVSPNTIAEVHPDTGACLNSFSTVTPINAGDLDVDILSGNMFVVTFTEDTVAEFTPDGSLVRELTLPTGVEPTGIAFDYQTGEAWVSSVDGLIRRIGGFRSFVRGDCNADGAVDVADPIYNLDYQFSGGPSVCRDAQDTNDDRVIDISDPIYNITYLFGMGSPPPAPFPDCGADPTADSLSCDSDQCP